MFTCISARHTAKTRDAFFFKKKKPGSGLSWGFVLPFFLPSLFSLFDSLAVFVPGHQKWIAINGLQLLENVAV